MGEELLGLWDSKNVLLGLSCTPCCGLFHLQLPKDLQNSLYPRIIFSSMDSQIFYYTFTHVPTFCFCNHNTEHPSAHSGFTAYRCRKGIISNPPTSGIDPFFMSNYLSNFMSFYQASE